MVHLPENTNMSQSTIIIINITGKTIQKYSKLIEQKLFFWKSSTLICFALSHSPQSALKLNRTAYIEFLKS